MMWQHPTTLSDSENDFFKDIIQFKFVVGPAALIDLI
jgi:hypothetical protein